MLGLGEILVVVSVGVLVLSWRKIPQIGGSIRKSLMGFKDGISGEDAKPKVRDVHELDEKKSD